jgi:hypothetical protein
MKRSTKLIPLAFIAVLLLAACSQTVTFSPEMQTSVANTVVALQTQTAAALPPTQQAATETVNPLATFTPITTFAPTNTPTLPAVPALWISSWSDVTIPTNSKFKARESFTKTWTLTNGGTAAWQKDFTIEFVSGDPMGVSSMPLGVVVAPGSSVQISMNLTAPVSLGTRKANYMLKTPNGLTFGQGENADRPFSVQIVVEDFFAVTAAQIKASVPSGATCPVDIKLSAKITANGTGDVTYYIVTSAGTSETFTMPFSGKGIKTSDPVVFTITAPGDVTAAIYVDNPNRQKFPPITISSPCTP